MKYTIPTDNLEYKKYEDKPIVYFCSEYGIDDGLPIYAGGLGILAGDILEEAGAMGLPFIAIGTLYSKGFKVTNAPSTHIIDPTFAGFTIIKNEDNQDLLIPIDLEEGLFKAKIWERKNGTARLFLLDFNILENNEEKREKVDFLYPPDFKKKLLEELLLGIGGVKLLRALNITASTYHLNEGHTAFALLALGVEYKHDHKEIETLEEALIKVKPLIVATKHTDLPDAGLFFIKDDIRWMLKSYLERHHIEFDHFFSLGTSKSDSIIFSTTRFLLHFSKRASAVSKRHALEELSLHPKSNLIPITNGVSRSRWQSEKINSNKDIPTELWRNHQEHKLELISYVEGLSGIKLLPDVLTIVWARRFTPYKRPELLFRSLERLASLVSNKNFPVQIIISGDANLSDSNAVNLLEELSAFTRDSAFMGKIVYVPRHSISSAKKFTKGADVWLNTPVPEREACGTSGMKAAWNGALALTTNGGWVSEAEHTAIGWIIPEENIENNIYDIIEKEIIPLYYDKKEGESKKWIEKMRSAIREIDEKFDAKRMITEYVEKLYFPKGF